MLTATITVSNNADWIQGFQWTDSGIAAPTLQAGGINYTSAPSVVCSPPVDANGNLVSGGKPAVVTCTISGGAVNALTRVDPGAGYVAGYPPKIYFVGGNGSGAAAFTTVGNPIDLTGSSLWLEIRQSAAAAQVFATVGSALPLTGITITNASNGQFTIIIPKASLQLMAPGQLYVHDLLRLRPDGYTERLWTGTISVDGGVTR